MCVQLEQVLHLETAEEERDSPESRSLAQQNVDLRRRLDEEQAAYKRKLTAYQEGQQRQAQLVQKLQAKVTQTLHLKHALRMGALGQNSFVYVCAGSPVQEEVCGSGTDNCECNSRYSPHFLSH